MTRSRLGNCSSPMGNLIQRPGRKTHPSVPQENGKCNDVQEELSQVIRNRDTCIFQRLPHHCPNAVQGGSAIPSLLANELEAESSLNCGRHHRVDSEPRGKRKHIGFHCQIDPFSATQGNACHLMNRNERRNRHSIEVWLPEGHPRGLLQVRHRSASSLLHECVCLQTFHIIPFFVRDGIDVDEPNALGLTALHLASKILSKKAIQMLLRCGANVNLTDPKTGRSALHFATQSSSSKGGATLAAGAECIKLLLRSRAEVRMRDRNGLEAIHFACRGGREDLVTLLLDYGADVNSLTSGQESPLFLFLEDRSNLRQAHLLDKLLSLSYPLKLTNSAGCLPKGLIFPRAGRLKETLLKMASTVLPLQEICKFNIRKMYGGKMKLWLETKLPADLWKSIYVDQEFSYASKMKAFD